ncbi:MAG: bifunctional precorrin-2 dehydrogenase/sirohydrochlorin ferrochelatase [Deltaproteobacteria bacterium]|nr:bifunctional precorrin-2 dehydrogenase/sirohydrochlorin ferrochelatase [Deltaproteobacteria bacterium]
MPQLPLNIEMHGRHALVVGGGQVACRKVKALLAAGASVRVVAPEMSTEITQLASAGDLAARGGRYRAGDLDGVFLAVAATDDPAVNRRVASEARRRGILVAVTDAPELGNCTFPAVLRRGGLEIGVATGGRCPAFAQLVRDLLAGMIGEEYGAALERAAFAREKLLTEGNDSTYNNQLVRSIAQRLIAELSEKKETP